MSEWMIIAVAALAAVIYRLKSIHVDFRDDENHLTSRKKQRQLKS